MRDALCLHCGVVISRGKPGSPKKDWGNRGMIIHLERLGGLEGEVHYAVAKSKVTLSNTSLFPTLSPIFSTMPASVSASPSPFYISLPPGSRTHTSGTRKLWPLPSPSLRSWSGLSLSLRTGTWREDTLCPTRWWRKKDVPHLLCSKSGRGSDCTSKRRYFLKCLPPPPGEGPHPLPHAFNSPHGFLPPL